MSHRNLNSFFYKQIRESTILKITKILKAKMFESENSILKRAIFWVLMQLLSPTTLIRLQEIKPHHLGQFKDGASILKMADKR
jgi:hypothetical protein